MPGSAEQLDANYRAIPSLVSPSNGLVAQQAGPTVATDTASNISYAPSITALSQTINNALPLAQPNIVQKIAAASTGSVATLAKAFGSSNIAGNSIIVVCAVGNGTAPTVADSAGNTYTQAAISANSTTFETAIFYAVNIVAGANIVTITNGGSTASMAMELYEVNALLQQVQAQPDQTATNTGISGTASTSAIAALSPNEYAFTGVAVGTAAQTITAGSGWTNDSGQQNPTTPAGLFSFASLSQYLGSLTSVTPKATFTSEPWAIAAATFRPVILGVEGTVNLANVGGTALTAKAANTSPTLADTSLVTALSPANTGLPVNVPTIVQKANAASTGNVASIAAAFTSNNVAGNTIIVVCGNGNNGTLTVTDSAGNTYTQAVLKANSTTYEAAIFYAVGIVAGANTVTVTNGGSTSSMAVQIYEARGLLTQVVAQPDQSTSGTSTATTTVTLSALAASEPNSLAFLGIAVGTGAAASSVVSGTNWSLDSTQNTTTPSGLFSFGALSQFLSNTTPVIPTATLGASEPYAAVSAIFKPVAVSVAGTVQIGGYNYTHLTSTGTTLVKTGAGVLHAIVMNKPTSTATVEADDALTNTNPMGILGAFAASIAPFTVVYDVEFLTGLSVTIGTAAVDATIVWK